MDNPSNREMNCVVATFLTERDGWGDKRNEQQPGSAEGGMTKR